MKRSEDSYDCAPPVKQSVTMAELRKKVSDLIQSTHVLVYSKTTCPFCDRVRNAVDFCLPPYTVASSPDKAVVQKDAGGCDICRARQNW